VGRTNERTRERARTPTPLLSLDRSDFSWRQILHVLLAHRKSIQHSGYLCDSEISAVSMRLFSHHRVIGCIVLPGVSHLALVGSSLLWHDHAERPW
jgi:hypothetical protein